MPGLIPARAGRTITTRSTTRPTRAHPRSRGADRVTIYRDPSVTGSSPLARGGRHDVAERDHAAGLIPARAGRTTTATWPRRRRRAHPRSRGADSIVAAMLSNGRGSSPLARGGHSEILVFPRIIELRRQDYIHFRARRYCAALLNPGRNPDDVGASLGRSMKCTPSRSTGSQSCRWVRNRHPCSFWAGSTRKALPDRHSSSTCFHNSSRRRLVTLPTKTPGLISRSQRVRWPRRPAGQAVRTMTTTGHRTPRNSFRWLPAVSRRPRARRHRPA